MTDSMDGVDSDLYDSGGDKSKPQSVDEQNTEEATDLMSKDSFPGGCKVGDKYQIEITGDHGDQFSVKVLDNEKEETSETKPDMEPDEELASMNKEY